MTVHEKVKKHKCHICSKPFPTAFELKRHVVVHEKLTDHHCDVCSCYFSRACDLKIHVESVHETK